MKFWIVELWHGVVNVFQWKLFILSDVSMIKILAVNLIL